MTINFTRRWWKWVRRRTRRMVSLDGCEWTVPNMRRLQQFIDCNDGIQIEVRCTRLFCHIMNINNGNSPLNQILLPIQSFTRPRGVAPTIARIGSPTKAQTRNKISSIFNIIITQVEFLNILFDTAKTLQGCFICLFASPRWRCCGENISNQ